MKILRVLLGGASSIPGLEDIGLASLLDYS